MAAVLPALLALILNISGYQLFLSPVHFPTSPFLSSVLFTFAEYFILLHLVLYPAKLRRIPRVFIRIYEFIVFSFLLEFGMCNVWFPLETFIFLTLSNIGDFIKNIVSATNILYPYAIQLSYGLQHYVTGIVLSYIMSLTFILFSLHSTYLIDLNIIREVGFFSFLKDSIETLAAGAQIILVNQPCRWHTVGVRQELKRLKKYEKMPGS